MTTHSELKQRLEKAMITLQQLPQSAHRKPIGYKTAWPDMIRPTKRGAILHRGKLLLTPNSHDISDCYKIIDALYQLSDMQRTLLWARAMNVAWQVLQRRYNRSRTHLNRLHSRALSALEAALDEAALQNSR